MLYHWFYFVSFIGGYFKIWILCCKKKQGPRWQFFWRKYSMYRYTVDQGKWPIEMFLIFNISITYHKMASILHVLNIITRCLTFSYVKLTKQDVELWNRNEFSLLKALDFLPFNASWTIVSVPISFHFRVIQLINSISEVVESY